MRKRGISTFEAGIIAAGIAAGGSGCKSIKEGAGKLQDLRDDHVQSVNYVGDEVRKVSGEIIDKFNDVFEVREEPENKPTDRRAEVKKEKRETDVEIKKELDEFSFENMFEETSEHASSADKKKRRGEIRRIMTSEKAMVYTVKFRGNKNAQKEHFKRPLEDKEYAGEVRAYIIKYCNKYNVPYDIAFSVGANESGFDQDKESGVGAVGVFQVMKIAAKDVGFDSKDRENLEKNIEMGIKYLAKLFDRYKKWDIALVIYSTGERNMKEMIAKKKGISVDEVETYLRRDDVDLITLYSGKFDKLGTKHPFQYPFQAAALGSMGRRVLENDYPADKIPLIMKDSEFLKALDRYPSLKRRIQKNPTRGFKGTSFIQEIERRFVRQKSKQKKRVASK